MFVRYLLLAVVFITEVGYSQSSSADNYQKYEKLLSGEMVPDLKLVLYKGGMDSVCTSFVHDFRGKTILFDFWDVYCGTCIGDMPHMAALQEEFKDKLQIIVVAREGPVAIKEMWDRYTSTSKTQSAISKSWRHLLFVTGDSGLNQMFPHEANPIHVWIDSVGRYKFSTHGINTTFKNVYDITNGRMPGHLGAIEYGGNEGSLVDSWIKSKVGYEEKVRFVSMMSKRIQTEAISGVRVVDRDCVSNKITGIACLNYSIEDLYADAFAGIAFPRCRLEDVNMLDFSRRIILNVKNKRQYVTPSVTDSSFFEWADDNTFCYSVRVPCELSDRVFYLMIDDLNRYFGLHGYLTYRYVDTYIIRKRDGLKLDKFLALYKERKKNGDIRDVKMSMRRLVDDIRGGFNSFSEKYVDFFAQGSEDEKVDVLLLNNFNFNSLVNIKNCLKRSGLEIIEGKRKLEPFMIIDSVFK